MSATEASRGFSDHLDAVARGETVTVTRGGRPVAEIRPAQRTTGRDLGSAWDRAASTPPTPTRCWPPSTTPRPCWCRTSRTSRRGSTADLRHVRPGRLRAGDRRAAQFDEDEVGIAAITVAEFRAGIELADTDERRRTREAVLADVLSQVEVLDYTAATAAVHARLLAHSRRSRRPRGAHDLILAAHAAETGHILVSGDAAARFGDLPGVEAISPS